MTLLKNYEHMAFENSDSLWFPRVLYKTSALTYCLLIIVTQECMALFVKLGIYK
jgi:hypothetical protein